jgi:hypothetical protein
LITYVSILTPSLTEMGYRAAVAQWNAPLSRERGASVMREKLVVRVSDNLEFTDAELRLSSRTRLDINGEDIARMVTEFAASRGITKCKPAYAALSHHYRV